MADITKLESELWEAADELRANSKLSSQEYCMPVLGLIFLRYAWGRFKRVDEQIDAERAKIEGRKPRRALLTTRQRARCTFQKGQDTTIW